ncbi:MAG: phosphoribosylanthranilate isomerase, partial [Pseudomonadales bacterium]
MVRVKICGLTQSADVAAACAAGADAVGFVFYAPSPRAVSPGQVKALLEAVAPLTLSVGLFVDPSEAAVEETLREAPVQLLQFHGDEPEAFCRRWDRPYIKALRMAPELDVEAAMAAYPSAAGFLLDAYEAGVPGGTGTAFSWDRVPAKAPAPIIL